MTSNAALRRRIRTSDPRPSAIARLPAGARALWGAARVPLSATIPVAGAVQLIVLLVTASQLNEVAATVGDLVAILGQEERPALSEAAPLAAALARSLAVVLGASVLAWAISAVAMTIAARRGARRTTTIRRLRPVEALISIVVVAATSLTVAVLAAALSAPFQDVVLTEVRGTTLTVLIPTTALIAVALIVTACSVVAGSVLIPTAFAVEPSSPRLNEGLSHSEPSSIPIRPQTILGPAVGALALAFVVIAALARPVSDDYRVMALVRDNGFFDYLGQHLTTETGRFSQGAANWILARALGDLVNPGTAVLIFALTALACGFALRVFAPGLSQAGRGAVWWLGAGFAVVSVFLVPSMVDSWLWFTAADVYMPGVAFALLGAGLARLAWDDRGRGGRTWALWAGAVVVIVVAQGFSEAASAVIWIAASVFLVFGLRQRDGRRRLLALVVWASASLGLALIALAPAQSARSGRIDSGNLVVGALGGAYSGLPLWSQIGIDGWLLILALALALASILQASATSRHLVVMGAVGAALLVLVPLLGGVIAFLGLNWVPWRTLTVPGVAFAWGSTLLFASVLTPLLRRALASGGPQVPRVVRGLLAVTLALGVVFTVPTVVALVEAGALRASMMTARDASVAAQLADGRVEISVTPAPPLVYPTDSRDFEFLEVQNKDWFYPGFQDWFGIPPGDTLRYETDQPIGYCVDDARVLLPGVVTCHELGAESAP